MDPRQQKRIRIFHAMLTVQKADCNTDVGKQDESVSLEREHPHLLCGEGVEQDPRKPDGKAEQLESGQLLVAINQPSQNDIQQRSDGIEHRGIDPCGMGEADIHKEILTCRLNQAEGQRIGTQLLGELDSLMPQKIRDQDQKPRSKEANACKQHLIGRGGGSNPEASVSYFYRGDGAAPKHGAKNCQKEQAIP